MSEERNAATYRRWFDEGCSQGNVDLADELYSPEYVNPRAGAAVCSDPGGAQDVHPRPARGDA